MQVEKKKYIDVVKFTLESMRDLAKTDKFYNLQVDVVKYYELTIKPEMVLSTQEFLDLCKEVGIE